MGLAAFHNLRNCSSYFRIAAAGTGLTSGRNHHIHLDFDSFRSRQIVVAADETADMDFAGIHHLAFHIVDKNFAAATDHNPNNS